MRAFPPVHTKTYTLRTDSWRNVSVACTRLMEGTVDRFWELSILPSISLPVVPLTKKTKREEENQKEIRQMNTFLAHTKGFPPIGIVPPKVSPHLPDLVPFPKITTHNATPTPVFVIAVFMMKLSRCAVVESTERSVHRFQQVVIALTLHLNGSTPSPSFRGSSRRMMLSTGPNSL